MMRHGNKVRVWGWVLTVDTSDDAWYVLCDPTGLPVARIARQDSGRRYRQGTNPDYTGFLAYHLQYRTPSSDEWRTWSDTAEKGDMTRGRFLEHLAEEHGHKRPPHRSWEEVHAMAKVSLEDFQSQGGRVTRKVVRDVVLHHGECLGDYTLAEVANNLYAIMAL